MQLITSLALLLITIFELSSTLVISPESYNYDPYECNGLQADKFKSFKGIRKILKKSSIIPDVLDPFIPSCYLIPSYFPSSSSSSSSSPKPKTVKLGNTLLPSQTQSPPSLQIFCPGKMVVEGGLTVILTDPDAPSRGDDSLSEMCHWIARVPEVVIELQGVRVWVNASDLVGVVDYKAPAPPKGTGKHRYVFVLLEGENAHLKGPEERKHWGFEEPGSGVREWAEKANLTVLGANFLYEKYHGEEMKEGKFEI
ncbi:50d2df29-4c6d-4642-ad4c-382fac93b2a7 [Sclerotinia trifoliorum]|uniref:50d2df29-4c6d-4642-ad4c-382fac93b2a7 n=1 Tax=Sclerotinia trifoliorum TaxID=28548 RepID=A0A8H2VLF2_9HELO|nr:50d2df29-4c6d-4642-ad4c-382fac93b2a7 [Sclerotinia trifoliorum]